MIAQLLPWSLLLPVAAPLLLCLLTTAVRSPRWLGWITLGGLLAGSMPLWPIFGLPATTPVLPWLRIDDEVVPFQLSRQPTAGMARVAVAALLLGAGALGLWSLLRLHDGLNGEGGQGRGIAYRPAAAGVLLSIAGAQLAVLSAAPLLAVVGLGIVLLGMFVIELGVAPPADDRALRAAVPAVIGLLLLLTSALGLPAGAADRLFWVLGCLLLLFAGPLRMARSGAALALRGTAEAVGVTPVAAWLLIGTPSGNTAITIGGYDLLTILGAFAFGVGAVNTAASTTLPGLLGGQWAAQLGLLLLVFGRALTIGGAAREVVFSALVIALVATLVLSLTVGKLVLRSGVDGIADLPAPRVPLRRSSLIYALAAASVAGLPFTPGYTLRQTLAVPGAPAFMAPLLLGGSSLLLVGLAIPLAAFVRRPALGPAANHADGRVFNGGLPIDEEPGWALPFAGLRRMLLLLTAEPWAAAWHRNATWVGRTMQPLGRLSNLVERRYYLGLIVVATISIALLAAGGAP